MNCEVRGEPFPPFVPSFPPFPTPRSLEENEPLSYLLRIIGLIFFSFVGPASVPADTLAAVTLTYFIRVLLRSTAARILRSLCHDVCVCVDV